MGDREARTEHGVGAEAALVVGAVEVEQLAVDLALVERLQADEDVGDLRVDVVDSGEHALAPVPIAAISQLDRLEASRARARRHDGPALGARLEVDLDLDGGVATGVEDLAACDVFDAGHAWTASAACGSCGLCDRCG